MSTQKEGTAKVDESVVNQPANSAATTAPKKRRRGISNETRTTSRKKFSHKDAINNLWLFVGHLHARVAWVTMKEDNNMRPAFAGKAIPQLVIEATSLHTNPADVRVASKTFWPYESNVDYIPGGAKEKFINMDFAWIKHFLDVVVFKGREMTDEESEMLELGYVDYDDNGQYEPVEVEDVIKLSGGKFGHVGHVVEGTFNVGDKAVFTVNEKNRALGAKNHSATHLLQKALREVLGTHVEQAGSLNNAEHLRFDFTHFSPLSDDEIARVEKIVNEKIAEDLPVVTKVMSMEDAKKTGAMALFGEKYGDEVRVVSMGDFSVELCGGTHVKNTGVITAFKILSETGVASGVRRIEAVTDQGVFNYYHKQEEELKEAAKALKATPATLLTRIESLLAEVKELKSENESLKSKLAKDALGDVMDQVEEVKGVKLLATSIEDVDMNGLRELGDNLKEKLGEGVIVLASQKDGKVFLVAMVTDEAQKAGAHAGNLIKAIAGCVGGGGGGRPNMAQAGGKNPAGIPEAVAKVKEILESQIS